MPLLLLVVLQALELQLVVRFAASLAVDRLRGDGDHLKEHR